MNEELAFNTTNTLSGLSQAELIAQYCGGIEERIRSAGSRDKAAAIVAETCKNFETACMSEIIRAFLQRYVRELLENHWNHQA